MIYIHKGEEPEQLKIFNRNWRKKNIPWGDVRVPPQVYADIRKSLNKEQNGYCAYCMRRIDDSCQIEHHTPRNGKNGNSLLTWSYSNMLGVDNAKTMPVKYSNLCENGRGCKSLTINPLDANHMKGIYYSRDGRIKHDKYQSDLGDVLKLNADVFKEARKTRFDVVDITYKAMINSGIKGIYQILKNNLLSSEPQNYDDAVHWYLDNLHAENII